MPKVEALLANFTRSPVGVVPPVTGESIELLPRSLSITGSPSTEQVGLRQVDG